MDANDLARWTRFAAKGGIGKCTAMQDCVAQGADDLMFLTNDEIVVLLQLPQEDQYLGYCEGVVGRFQGSAVRFHGKLKKPVFAKRQSGVGPSPSRPISISPPASSPVPSGVFKSKSVSPPGVRVPSLSSAPTSDAKPGQPSRIPFSSISPPAIRHHGSSHSRTASTTSSSSHYSAYSQPVSRVPEPLPINTHARTASNTSSRSVSGGIGTDFSESAQLVSLPSKPPLPVTTATPALTDGSSAHSSFLWTPAPAPSTMSPPPNMVTSSLSQGRARSGSEKFFSRGETRELRRRSGSENYVVNGPRFGEDQWNFPQVGDIQQDAIQGKKQTHEHLPTGASEFTIKSASIFSEASNVDTGRQSAATTTVPRYPLREEDRDVLQEDESDEDAFYRDGERAHSVSGLSDLSDGGFGIGMSLLRENDDSDYEDDDNREDEDTAIGHDAPTKGSEEDDELPKPRVVGMRVMNPDNESPSGSESESADEAVEDDTIIPKSDSQSQSISTSGSTSTTSYFPASSSSETAISIPSASVRRTLPTHESSSTITSRRTPSIAPTEDERWESDGDIYDDYRYSRYSSHSPAQRSSTRASRSSTKSTRSRASERPPLPEEDVWRRGTENATPPRKSRTSERSWSSASGGLEAKPSSQPVASLAHQMVTHDAEVLVNNPVSREVSNRTPPPSDEATVAVTPGDLSIATMSATSPLTRAFRQSDASIYSRQSQEHENERSRGDDALNNEEIFGISSLPQSPPRPEQKKSENTQRTRSKSPALASSLRENIQSEMRPNSPSMSMAAQPQLSVLTSQIEYEPSVVVLNESPSGSESPSPVSPDANHLRIASPQSHNGSAPPSPLNPGYPPSPSSMTSFAGTAPLNINKSPLSSPITPRHPISPPAIPFTGVPPPGRPPPHMQYAQLQPYQWHPSQHYSQQGTVPLSESVHSALRMAKQQQATTIHGHVQMDLLTATGPVPISFRLPGMSPPHTSLGTQMRPQPAAPQPPYGQLPAQSQNRTQSPMLELELMTSSQQQDLSGRSSHLHNSQQQQSPVRPPGWRPITAPVPAPGVHSLSSIDTPRTPPSPDAYRTNHVQSMQSDGRTAGTPPPSSSATAPLPRANFFPKVGQARPRSRSFSGFNSEITEKISQSMGRRSQEEGSQPFGTSTSASRPSSLSSKMPIQTLAPSPMMGPTRGKSGQLSRPAHGPSPLSLPPTTSSSPSSPLEPQHIIPRIAPSPVRSLEMQDSQTKRITTLQTPSHSSLRQAYASTSAPSPVVFPKRRDSGPSLTHTTHGDDGSSLRPPSPLRSPAPRQSQESDRTHTSFTRSDISTPPPVSNGSLSSSPLAKSGSLRSKISISAMRAKGPSRNVREGASETPTSTNGPVTPTDEETVQIKDMEFELVRPVLVRASSDHEESLDSKDRMPTRTADLDPNSSNSRSETMSLGALSSSNDLRLVSGNTSPEGVPYPRKSKVAETNNAVQAHRDRELKWISTMNSSDAAQARKSKKVKKLLVEGVPSSVRYLVWAHLSNSGSKKMSNVYAQLSKRRPPLAIDIERDVEQSFPDHQHLRDPNGPLVSVLFAYIAMVPDLRYHRGLAIIAGNLLLQSPEEDAFWTFLAMMDSHLRPYFMPTSPQMGVDTTLFIKAVEAADPQLAKRVFIELKVRPQELCGVWFSSVFAGTLPLGHLHRVWDLFFYEGIPFLFRVGLTILSLSRRHLLESPKAPPTSYTAYLLRPPPEALPTDPEQFISQTLTVKLKDDDIRKMRLKMTETALKQLRAPRMSTSQSSHERA